MNKYIVPIIIGVYFIGLWSGMLFAMYLNKLAKKRALKELKITDNKNNS
jgi:hypothetical protein